MPRTNAEIKDVVTELYNSGSCISGFGVEAMKRKTIHKKWKVEVKSEQNGVVPLLGNGQESSDLSPPSQAPEIVHSHVMAWRNGNFRTVKAATESITIELRNIVGSTAISGMKKGDSSSSEQLLLTG
jgi:hypothetical protein